MNTRIENMHLQLSVSEKILHMTSAARKSRFFWDWYNDTYGNTMKPDFQPQTDIKRAICTYHIGEFGVCISTPEYLTYIIAGTYTRGRKPDGLDPF